LLEEGFNETDVARRMGMNPAAVRQRKSRIVRKLAEVVKS
jgi:DNA-directed RNA polymerase specialized sigma24 family protein